MNTYLIKDLPGEASLGYSWNRAKITAHMCEKNPYIVEFSCRRSSYPV